MRDADSLPSATAAAFFTLTSYTLCQAVASTDLRLVLTFLLTSVSKHATLAAS